MSDRVDLISYWFNRNGQGILGQGKFGMVYKGHSTKDENQLFAIKWLRKEGLDEREIQILKELSTVQHSNLVRLIDHVEVKYDVYLVMEYCNGGDLASYLKEVKTMDVPSIKILLQQIAPAMKVLFEHNIIHRDLKPANILLSHNGSREINNITFKIADFGVGRFLDENEMAETFCGSPAFMAPEILTKKKYDYKADLWSLGGVVYCCLTGKQYVSYEKAMKDLTDIDPSLKDLLQSLLCDNPAERISFNDFYRHPFIDLKLRKHQGRISITDPITSEQEILSPDAPRLTSIDEKDSSLKPIPSTSRPFKDIGVFENVDKHAVKVSKTEYNSFREIVEDLINAKEVTNELEKARVLFSWMCSKDLTELNFHSAQKDSPEEAFQRHGATYATVYQFLCGYAGLQCKTIIGYSKMSEYKIGIKFLGDQGKHSWNAVHLDGIWRIVDCRAARIIIVNETARDVVTGYDLDEFYFMPDPRELIFTHFPDDRDWQLLEKPITLTDFENQVPVTSTFFKYGFKINSHREAVIYAKQEESIHIGCPLQKLQPSSFTFHLSYDNGKEEFQGISLERFVMHEVANKESVFTIRLPQKSSYRLIIYAGNSDSSNGEHRYLNVCEYKMYCETNPARPLPFPPVAHSSWGPRDSKNKYNLVPLQNGVNLHTVKGLAEVRFQVPKYLYFSSKIKSIGKDEGSLDGCMMYRMVGGIAIFTFRAPCSGEFGLEIYANDPDVYGNELHNVYQYLIVCNETVDPEQLVELPGLSSGFLGPQPAFEKFGLATASHADPYIETDLSEFEVDFKAIKPIRMSLELSYCSGKSSSDESQYALQQTSGDVRSLWLKLPKLGFYKLQIYARPTGVQSKSLSGVYNYLIRYTNGQGSGPIPYPRQQGQWGDGCYLHEPLEGRIQSYRVFKGSATPVQEVHFKVDVPNAKSVAVVIGKGEGNEWKSLERKPSGSWEGEIDMEKHWGNVSEVTVCANYGRAENSYSTLLSYSV